MSFIRAATVALAILSALIPSAQADTVTILAADGPHTPISRDLANVTMAFADRQFPASPCRGRVEVVLNAPRSTMPVVEGEAAHVNGMLADGYAVPWECATRIAPVSTPDALCHILVHEYGHLAGLEHTDEPGHPMAPAVNYEYPPCVRMLDRYARRTRVGDRQAIKAVRRKYRRTVEVSCVGPRRDGRAAAYMNSCDVERGGRLDVWTVTRVNGRIKVRPEESADTSALVAPETT